jgi:hypothetical protein
MTFASRLAATMLAAFLALTVSAAAQQAPPPQAAPPYQAAPAAAARPKPRTAFGPDEIGECRPSLLRQTCPGPFASVIERAVSQWGLPNGYILGEEGAGAFVAGLRYGEGTLYTKNAGDLRVYWQGPSVGFDWGGDGARTMTLVYNLPSTQAIYQRFVGIDGSAYIVGGVRHDGVDVQQHRAGADPLRHWAPTRRQHRLSEIHAARDLEPVLMRRWRAACAPPPARFTLTRHWAGACPVRRGNVIRRFSISSRELLS